MTQQQTQQRMTVHDAARKLSISEDAVRMRIKRGTLEAEKEDGRLYVLLDPDPMTDPRSDPNGTSAAERALTAELLEELRSRVSYLEGVISTRDEEIRRRDVIISQLTQRIPELESGVTQEPAEGRESTQEVRVESDHQNGSDGLRSEGDVASAARPWWRRVLGG